MLRRRVRMKSSEAVDPLAGLGKDDLEDAVANSITQLPSEMRTYWQELHPRDHIGGWCRQIASWMPEHRLCVHSVLQHYILSTRDDLPERLESIAGWDHIAGIFLAACLMDIVSVSSDVRLPDVFVRVRVVEIVKRWASGDLNRHHLEGARSTMQKLNESNARDSSEFHLVEASLLYPIFVSPRSPVRRHVRDSALYAIAETHALGIPSNLLEVLAGNVHAALDAASQYYKLSTDGPKKKEAESHE